MDNSIYKKCTECGQTKHISEFSKSYPNRCKTCVAEHTRQMRAAEKLKAKVKVTGEVIDVEPSGTMQVLCGSFITKDGRRMPGTALEFEKAIDWEQRRYEIAKEPERFFIQNLIDRFYTNYTSRDIITYRRDYAIKKLKEFEQALSELGDKDEL